MLKFIRIGVDGVGERVPPLSYFWYKFCVR